MKPSVSVIIAVALLAVVLGCVWPASDLRTSRAAVEELEKAASSATVSEMDRLRIQYGIERLKLETRRIEDGNLQKETVVMCLALVLAVIQIAGYAGRRVAGDRKNRNESE
mgnify:CR=1 FL=1